MLRLTRTRRTRTARRRGRRARRVRRCSGSYQVSPGLVEPHPLGVRPGLGLGKPQPLVCGRVQVFPGLGKPRPLVWRLPWATEQANSHHGGLWGCKQLAPYLLAAWRGRCCFSGRKEKVTAEMKRAARKMVSPGGMPGALTLLRYSRGGGAGMAAAAAPPHCFWTTCAPLVPSHAPTTMVVPAAVPCVVCCAVQREAERNEKAAAARREAEEIFEVKQQQQQGTGCLLTQVDSVCPVAACTSCSGALSMQRSHYLCA